MGFSLSLSLSCLECEVEARVSGAEMTQQRHFILAAFAAPKAFVALALYLKGTISVSENDTNNGAEMATSSPPIFVLRSTFGRRS